jgi:hypothetical protein
MVQRGRKSAASFATLPVIEPEPPRNRPPPAPDHLSPEMKAWWESVTAERGLAHHHLRLLEAACGGLGSHGGSARSGGRTRAHL